ncbi:MAG: 3-hydroxyacyl-CoA dehydrogenase NAD-binding domain-containing protein, partial [bacterium]
METKRIERVALIGAGVIGSAWAARLLLNGVDVRIHDPSDQAARRVEQVIDNALRAYRKMTMAPVARSGRLTFADSARAAVADADFVQESGPERIEIKTALLREVCDATDADVVVASSSSGLLPSAMQSGVRHPERVLVGHPFNPVYLIPLIEIVGGEQTSARARETAAAFYRSIGMHPLQVRKEIDAFLADRMMEALWREALHLVNEGVASVDEIDQAICYGPGLRWSFMGTFMVYRIAGGE